MLTMSPSAANEPISGYHSVKMSGGSPAAIAERILAVLVDGSLGMFVSVTWIPGWLALNVVTILLSSCRVEPDHIVHQVRWTTPELAPAVLAPVAPRLTAPSTVAAARPTASLDVMRLFHRSRRDVLAGAVA